MCVCPGCQQNLTFIPYSEIERKTFKIIELIQTKEVTKIYQIGKKVVIKYTLQISGYNKNNFLPTYIIRSFRLNPVFSSSVIIKYQNWYAKII